jgi:hypothetical protein
MNKNRKHIIFTLSLVYIILTISAFFIYKFLTERLEITIEIKSEKNAFMQIFYDTGKGYNGKERQDVWINANANYQIITSAIPSNRIRSLRIDPLIEPGTVFIRSIMIEGLSGRKTWSAMDIVRDFGPQRDITKFDVVNDSLQIDSSGNDPQFVSVRPIPDVGKINKLTIISLLPNLVIIVMLFVSMIVINFAYIKDKVKRCLVCLCKAMKDCGKKGFPRHFLNGMKAISIILFVYLFAMKFLLDTSRFVVNSNSLLDGGWLYALARLPELGMDLGRNVFFTAGPLASKLPAVIIPGDLQQQYLTHIKFIVVAFFLYAFYPLILIKLNKIYFAYAILGALSLLNPFLGLPNDSIIYATIAILSILFYGKSKNGQSPILSLFCLALFSAAAFLFKISWGIPGLFSILTIICIAIGKKNIILLRYSTVCLAIYISALFGFYIYFSNGSITSFFEFIKHSYDQSRLYSQVMAISPFGVEPYIFVSVLFLCLLTALIFIKEIRIPVLIVAPTLFMTFKGSFVRADYHMLFFFSAFPLILTCIPIGVRTKSITSKNLLFISLILLSLIISYWSNKIFANCFLFNIKQGHEILSTYVRTGIKGYIEERMNQSKENLAIISKNIDIKIKDAAKGHWMAVIPWALAIPEAINAKPLFYPSLQFYSGYTEGLDKANLKYFKMLDEKSYVLLEFVSIDGRYPLYDAPRTYEWLLANYQVIENSEKYILLGKSKKTTNIVCKEPFLVGSRAEINLKDQEPLQNDERTGKIQFKRLIVKNLVGIKYALRALLLRAPYTFIKLELSNGEIYKFRIFPELLQRGLWLSPFIRNQNDIKSWTSGSPESIPKVIKVTIEEYPHIFRYTNKKPRIYIQDCYLD